MWPYCPMQSCTYYLSYIHTNVFRTAHYTIWAHVLRSISYTTWEATDERFVFSITIMFLYFFPDCSSVKLSKYILMQGDVRNQRLVQPIRGKCLKIVLIETFGDILQTFETSYWLASHLRSYYTTRCILLPENLRPVYVPKFEGKTCKNLGKFCQKCQKTSSGPTCRILLSYFLMGVAF